MIRQLSPKNCFVTLEESGILIIKNALKSTRKIGGKSGEMYENQLSDQEAFQRTICDACGSGTAIAVLEYHLDSRRVQYNSKYKKGE